jgi:hypothetical protein
MVDNVDDEVVVESQRGGQSIKLASLLPQSGHGTILVMSRNADVACNLVDRQQHIIEFVALSADEAVALLQNKLGESLPDEALQLVDSLDRIPLAIVQAAAYISRLAPRMSVEKELKAAENQVQLLKRAASDMRRNEEARQESVLATW